MSDDRDKIKYLPEKERRKSAVKMGSVISIASQNALFTRRGDEKADDGDYLGALKMYRRALKNCAFGSDEANDLLLRIADAYLDMNCYSDAAARIAPLLFPGCPEFREACFRLGHCLAGRGEFSAAKDAFWLSLASDESAGEKALEPDDAANALDCIDFCDQYIDEDNPVPTLRDSDEIEIERILADAAGHTDKGEFDRALPILEEGFEKYPDSRPVFTDLLLAYYCEQRFHDGMLLYNGAPEKLRDDFTVQCCAAMIFSRLGLRQQERECAEKLKTYRISDTQEIVRAFATMMELGLFDSALDYALRVYEQEPYNRNFIHFCAHSAYRLGKTETAKSYYERSLAIEPNDSVAAYYKKVCEQTLGDGLERSIQIDYAVPHGEFIARCKFTEELSHCSAEKLRELWDEEPGKILMMTDWAMTDRNCPYADFYLVLLALLDKDRAESILRRLLVEPDCSDGLRRVAAARLGSIAHEKKFCLLRDGAISVCSFGDPIGYAQWPQSYRRIMELIYNDLMNGSQKALAEAIKLCFGYASANMKEHPRLPYGQSEAMAAAIVYFVKTHDPESETPDPEVFAAEHGVTVRRLENALKRLFERKARDIVDALLSEGELSPAESETHAGGIFPLDPEKGGDDDDE
jgi:hypothetical protein